MHRLLLAIILMTPLSGCTTGGNVVESQPPVDAQTIDDAQQSPEKLDVDTEVLEIASKEPQVTAFIAANPGHRHEITVLAPETIEGLSEKYPVIYGDLPEKTLYKIDYKDQNGMLVIVDLENEKVLRYFRTSGVSLG